MEMNKQDLGLWIGLLDEADNATRAQAFARFDANKRAAYLAQLGTATRADGISHRHRAILWGQERLLRGVDRDLRNAGR
jgi:hypothetical protein